MFWPLALCDTHIHAGSPILLSHQLDVIRRVSLWLLDWTPLMTEWLPTKSFHTGYRCWFISLPSSGINGSVTSCLLPGFLPPTCRRLKRIDTDTEVWADLPLPVQWGVRQWPVDHYHRQCHVLLTYHIWYLIQYNMYVGEMLAWWMSRSQW